MDIYLQRLLKILRSEDRVATLRAFDSPVLRDLFYLAYSPSVNLRLPKEFPTGPGPSQSPSVYRFHKFFIKASDNICRDGLTEEATVEHLLDYPEKQRKVLYKFLNKSLGLNFSVHTINTALKFCIPTHERFPLAPYSAGVLKYPLYCLPFYDGHRYTAIKYINNVSMFSELGVPEPVGPDFRVLFQDLPPGIYDMTQTPDGKFHVFHYTRLHELYESELSPKDKAKILSSMLLIEPLVAHSVWKIKKTQEIRKYYKHYKQSGADGIILLGHENFSVYENAIFVLSNLY